MQFRRFLFLLGFGANAVFATSGWDFVDGTISVQSKGAGVGGGSKEKLSPLSPLTHPIKLGNDDSLKVLLTAQENSTPKRPHQAFLNLREPETGLETSYALTVKPSGKGKVELTQKDLPIQFLTAPNLLEAALVVGSFGSAEPYKRKLFDLDVSLDPNSRMPKFEKPLRYGKQPEIHHVFRPDPKSPPTIVSIFFAAIVLAVLPTLLGLWLFLGANVNHLPKAIKGAPLAHALFFGSIVAMEGIFFMYYTSWNLFHTLPVVLGVGSITFFSGSYALTEVQNRRLAGLR